MESMYLRQLLNLTRQHGTLAEQQLVERWAPALDSLVKPAERSLLNGTTGLEFGIEDALTLKVNLKSRGPGIAPGLLAIMEASPALASWGQFVLSRQLRFHCGLKMTPDRLTHEIYAYPRNHEQLSTILGESPFMDAVRKIRPLGIGIDDHRGYSMYFAATDIEWVETLRQELGLADWNGATLRPWQQMRYDGHQLIPGKTGMDVTPLPVGVLARFATHYPFPYFRYLIPLKPHANGNFGRDPVSGRFALYATVN